MNIKEIEQDKNYLKRTLYGQRCCRKVQSTGTAHFHGQKNRCARLATFKLNGVALCTQHAGEMSLKHLINLQTGEQNDH